MNLCKLLVWVPLLGGCVSIPEDHGAQFTRKPNPETKARIVVFYNMQYHPLLPQKTWDDIYLDGIKVARLTWANRTVEKSERPEEIARYCEFVELLVEPGSHRISAVAHPLEINAAITVTAQKGSTTYLFARQYEVPGAFRRFKFRHEISMLSELEEAFDTYETPFGPFLVTDLTQCYERPLIGTIGKGS